jgi:CBS domain-containing protein
MIASSEVGSIALKRSPTRIYDAIALFGLTLLVAGLIFLARDTRLFDQWYEWIVGPFLWMMGCTLMITWAAGHLAHIGAGKIQARVTEVAVKRTEHAIITDPHTIAWDRRLGEAIRKMEQAGVGTLPVVDAERRLLGLLTHRDVRFVDSGGLVSDRMTPRERLVVHTGMLSLGDAERVMAEGKVKKLPLVNSDDTLLGIIIAKDLIAQDLRATA